MSGGHYDYINGKFSDFAKQIRREVPDAPPPERALRRAFAALVEKVARAAYELEWCDSGDTGWDQAEPVLRAVVTPTEELDAAIAEARTAATELATVVASATALRNRT